MTTDRAMDAERQPLLNGTAVAYHRRQRRFAESARPDEEMSWRRVRCMFVFMCLAAMLLFVCMIMWPWYFTITPEQTIPTPDIHHYWLLI